MYAEERQQLIAEQVVRATRVSVADLAEQFQVTTETVRRDLESLDRRGVLRRVHGGAVVADRLSLVEPGIPEREASYATQKDAIARAALSYLPKGEHSCVILDSGTTLSRFAAGLRPGSVGSVITNSFGIAAVLQPEGFEVHLLGGKVRGLTQACVGPDTLGQLSRLRCDVAFLGANGITARHGASTPDRDEAAVKQAIAAAADTVVVLADSSKVGAELMVSFVAAGGVDVLVTDSGIDPRHAAELADAGIEVAIA